MRNTHAPTAFQQRVYDALCKVPKGKVTTYLDLAHAIGIASPRAIGQALKRNPFAPTVPCHRVVASGGKIGGFFGQAEGEHVERKIILLKQEGIIVKENRIIDFEKRRHRSFEP